MCQEVEYSYKTSVSQLRASAFDDYMAACCADKAAAFRGE